MVFILDPKRFSELPPATDLDGSEIVPIVKDGENDVATVDTILEGRVLGVGVHTLTVSDTEPPSPEIGELWVDTN